MENIFAAKLSKQEKLEKKKRKLEKLLKGKKQNASLLAKELKLEHSAIYLAFENICGSRKNANRLWNDTIGSRVYNTSDEIISDSEGITIKRYLYIGNFRYSKYHLKFSEEQIQDLESGKTFNIYSGKYYTLFLEPTTKYEDGKYYIFNLTWVLSIKYKDIEFLNISRFPEENKPKLALAVINDFLSSQEGTISPIFDFSIKVNENNPITGIVKVKNGDLLYVPPKVINNRAEFIEKIMTSSGLYYPRNFLILYDLNINLLVQTNSVGRIEEIDLSGYSKITDEDIYRTLDSTVNELTSKIPYTFIENIDVELRSYIYDNKDKKLAELDQEKVIAFFKELNDAIEKRETYIVPSLFYNYKCITKLVLDNIKDFNKIKENIDKKREAFNNADINSLKPLYDFNPNLSLFPHQAEVLAKLQNAGELAILDIATGGGKTPLIIADICHLLNEGKIKRPLVVVPKHLVGGWIDKILYFTNNTYNPISICTETINSWKKNRIDSIIENAPPNSIFITTYSFLINDRYEEHKINIFPNVEYIKNVIKPDYVALDESHRIKNDSLTNEAIMQLRDAKYKRLATGTLIANTPADLVGQLAFLNPRILGTREQFCERYGEEVRHGKIYKFKPNAIDLIREDLVNNTFYIRKREKDWAATLPLIKYNYHFVDFNEAQKARYSSIVTETIQEIMENDKLRALWEEWTKADPDDELSEQKEFLPLMAKLLRLEQFTTAPDYDNFVKGVNEPEISESPKLKLIDDLIEETLKKGQKCIVGVHYRWSARHLYERSRFKDVAAYYDAGYRDVLKRFADKDSKIKVMFAVIQSFTEGVDLPIAKRLILADVDWTPGNIKQFIARAWRPEGAVVKKDEVLYVDFVLTNESVDVLKLARVLSKKIINAKITDECPITPPTIPFITVDNFRKSKESIQNYLNIDEEYSNWINKEIEKIRETGTYSFIKPKLAESRIEKKKIIFPWVSSMRLVHTEGGVPLLSYLENRDFDVENLDSRRAKQILKNGIVLTEFGKGKILGIRKKSIRVKLTDGSFAGHTAKIALTKVILLEEAPSKELLREKKEEIRKRKRELKEDLKKKLKERKKAQKQAARVIKKITKLLKKEKDPIKRKELKIDLKIAKLSLKALLALPEEKEKYVKKIKELQEKSKKLSEKKEERIKERKPKIKKIPLDFMLFNGIYSLITPEGEPEFNKLLENLGFYKQNTFYYILVRSKKAGLRLLNRLEEEYNIPSDNKRAINLVLDSMRKGRNIKEKYIPKNIKLFYKLSHKKAPKGTLKVYPLIKNDKVFFMVDKNSHPNVNLKKFRFKKSSGVYYYYMTKNSSNIRKVILQLIKMGYITKKKSKMNRELKKYTGLNYLKIREKGLELFRNNR